MAKQPPPHHRGTGGRAGERRGAGEGGRGATIICIHVFIYVIIYIYICILTFVVGIWGHNIGNY